VELALATTDDILEQLRGRGMRFVFAGIENSNRPHGARIYCAGQGMNRQDLLHLVRELHVLFQVDEDGDTHD
jgi:hypothetical protein